MQIKKKVIISILMLLMLSLSLNASDIRETNSDSFTVQAGYGTVIGIDIEPIPAQSVAYIAGMPFDIEDAMVQFDSSPDGGRTIARFSILSNTNFKITFDGEPMKYMGEVSANATVRPTDLHYYLYFDCELGVYRNGIVVPVTSDGFNYSSRSASGDNPKEQSWSPNVTGFDTNSYVGNVEGTIRFMFDEETSNFIKTQSDDINLPPGTYGAEVKIYIEEQ